MMSDIKEVAERLWSRVIERPSGCKEWTGLTSTNGYGRIWANRKAYITHRLAWEITKGDIPSGLCVLHACDNPLCCNIDHLWLGTMADNMIDMSAKGRASNQSKTHCPSGHIYDKANTYISSQGWRYCRECKRTRDRNHYNFKGEMN